MSAMHQFVIIWFTVSFVIGSYLGLFLIVIDDERTWKKGDHAMIASLKSVKKAIRAKYAWPGGYEFALLMNDGGILCTDCARHEFRQIVYSHLHQLRDGWRIDAVTTDQDFDEWEHCAHCSEVIGQ
jgi:hypothetical protein